LPNSLHTSKDIDGMIENIFIHQKMDEDKVLSKLPIT
jgi:hypothetical protein